VEAYLMSRKDKQTARRDEHPREVEAKADSERS